MSILKYKDYQGEVSYEDGILIVRLLHIDDLITAECDKASDAKSVFEDLVEDYIKTCRAVGKEPCKPFRGTFNVRVGPATHRQIAMLATEEGVTLNAWVAHAIEARAAEQKIRRQALSPEYIQSLFVGQEASRHVVPYTGWEVKRRRPPTIPHRRDEIAMLFQGMQGNG